MTILLGDPHGAARTRTCGGLAMWQMNSSNNIYQPARRKKRAPAAALRRFCGRAGDGQGGRGQGGEGQAAGGCGRGRGEGQGEGEGGGEEGEGLMTPVRMM